MQRVRKMMIPLALVGVLAVSGSVKSRQATAQSDAPDKPKTDDVAIVSPLPLPVSVTLNPGQALPVTISGPLITRDVGTTAGHPFQLQAFGQFDTSNGPFHVAFASNTTGRRMIVEHVAFSVQIRNPATVTGAVLEMDGLVATVFSVLPVPDPGGAPLFSSFGGSAPLKTYLEANKSAELKITTGGALATPDGSIILNLFGFLVDP